MGIEIMECEIKKLESSLDEMDVYLNEIILQNDVELFFDWDNEYREIEKNREYLIKKIKPKWYKATDIFLDFSKAEKECAMPIYKHFSEWEKTSGGCCYWCRLKFYEDWRNNKK